MFADPIRFYFVKQGAHGPLSIDLAHITDQLGTYTGDGIGFKRDAVSLTISYDQSPIKAILQIDEHSNLPDSTLSSQMVLTCERIDATSINLLRNIISGMGYRVFNPELGAYNSNDPDLLDLTTLKIDERAKKIMTKNGFKPLFNYRNNLIYFALKEGEMPVYQINSDLLLHLIEHKPANFDQQDFAVKVANDIGHFIALYDKGMIQGNFYANTRKIFNFSNIEVKKLKRDIFIRPVFFKYNDEKQSFDQIHAHATKRLKVTKGEYVNISFINRILKEMGITKKLISAKIQRNINFEENDKSKDAKLIPRLNMIIFVD